MIETFNLIASIVAITGAAWAISKFFLRPYIEKEKRYKNLVETIEDHFNDWKTGRYYGIGGALVQEKKLVSEINKFRLRLLNLGDEKLAYLLRNAIQNGIKGDWGYWLVINKENGMILPALVSALDGLEGVRPKWRAAYILEKTFGDKISHFYERLPNEMKDNEEIRGAFEVMSSTGIEKHMLQIVTEGDKELKRKAKEVLKEIQVFSKYMEDYAKWRSQSAGWTTNSLET